MTKYKRKKNTGDWVYNEIAARYVERYGATLQREIAKNRIDAAFSSQSQANEKPVKLRSAIESKPRTSGGWSEIAVQEPRVKKSTPANAVGNALKDATIQIDKNAPSQTGSNASPQAEKNAPPQAEKNASPQAEKNASPQAEKNASPIAEKNSSPISSENVDRHWLITGDELDKRILLGLSSVRKRRNAMTIIISVVIIACLAAAVPMTGMSEWFVNGWRIATGTLSEAGEGDAGRHFEDETQTTGEPRANAETTQLSETTADTTAYERLITPIGFPVNPPYTVAGSMYDEGTSVYFITSELQDNIVISLRRGSLSDETPESLTPVSIGGIEAYVAYREDYSLMTFEKDGVIYEATCRYNLNSLIDFFGFENVSVPKGAPDWQTVEGGLKNVVRTRQTPVPLKSGILAYPDVRRQIFSGNAPSAYSVTVDEMINYFPYENGPETKADGVGETKPDEALPGGIQTYWPSDAQSAPNVFYTYYEIGKSPFNADAIVALIRIKALAPAPEDAPPANVTFLINTTGSMFAFNKLSLIKEAVGQMAEQMTEWDRISVVVYGDGANVLLDGAVGSEKAAIRTALDGFTIGGYTVFEAGAQRAFSVASNYYQDDCNNIVIAVTDGDDFFGMPGRDELYELISLHEEEGIRFRIVGLGTADMNDAYNPQGVQGETINYAHMTDIKAAAVNLLGELAGNAYLTAEKARAEIEFNPNTVSSFNFLGYQSDWSANRIKVNAETDPVDIYSGENVTMLCELTLVSKDFIPQAAGSGASTAQAAGADGSDAAANDRYFLNELLHLRIKYTDVVTSQNMVYSRAATFDDYADENSADFKFACAVAAFGESLKKPDGTGAAPTVAETLASAGAAWDKGGYRASFLDLLRQYKRLSK